MPVVVVGDDTDLLVLLQNHLTPTENETIYPQTSIKLIDISILQKNLEANVSHSLLFIHSLSACNTTSRPYDIGKEVMCKYRDPQEVSNLFMIVDARHDDIEQSR